MMNGIKILEIEDKRAFATRFSSLFEAKKYKRWDQLDVPYFLSHSLSPFLSLTFTPEHYLWMLQECLKNKSHIASFNFVVIGITLISVEWIWCASRGFWIAYLTPLGWNVVNEHISLYFFFQKNRSYACSSFCVVLTHWTVPKP